MIIPWDFNSGDYSPRNQDSRNQDSGDRDFREPSFEAVLDTTCERLREKHIQYSIRRIKEMEQELMRLEAELNEFIGPLVRRPLVRGSKVRRRVNQ